MKAEKKKQNRFSFSMRILIALRLCKFKLFHLMEVKIFIKKGCTASRFRSNVVSLFLLNTKPTTRVKISKYVLFRAWMCWQFE